MTFTIHKNPACVFFSYNLINLTSEMNPHLYFFGRTRSRKKKQMPQKCDVGKEKNVFGSGA